MGQAPATPRVDFYVLETADERALLLTVCRLVEKAYLAEQTVYVHTDSAQAATALDDLLWTYSDRSFVPHALAGADGSAPVRIGCAEPLAAQVLVQLGSSAPAFYASYERIADFVDADPQRRDDGRRRFAWYRDQGVRPETHKVGADPGR